MRKVEIIYRDFKRVSQLQPDWRGTRGRANLEDRKIYIDSNLPARTLWGERVILEHEKAHFVPFDIGLDDEMSPAQEELFADWLGLVRTPNKNLHINEIYMKRWLLGGRRFAGSGRVAVLVRIIRLLALWPKRDPRFIAKAMLKNL